MKTAEEILFDRMQLDETGKILPLTDEQIIEAMNAQAIEVLTEYILQSTRCGSRFEADRAAKIFLEKELF